MRIALVGYMGSGKSTVGRLLAEQMNIPFIDLDKRIELKEGLSISDIFRTHGEAYFRKIESQVLQEILSMEETFALATGGGTPCFNNQMNLLMEHGTTIYLQCTSSILYARLEKSNDTRPVLANLNEGIDSHLKEREKFYSQAQIIVNGELSAPELSQYIFHLLS